MFSTASKRNLWKYEETMEMLTIMKENNCPKMFNNKHNKNMLVCRMIEGLLKQRGYTKKSSEQVFVRWKNLKNLYLKAKRSKSKNERDLFPYYNEMDELIGQKDDEQLLPSVNNQELPSPSANNEELVLSDHTDQEEEEQQLEEAAKSPNQNTTNVTTDETLPTTPRKWPARPSGTRRVYTKSDRPNRKLELILADSKRELNDEFYRTQKRLIDHEYQLYVKMEEELIGRIQETTKGMLDDCMDRFFYHLKDVVGQLGYRENMVIVDAYEEHSD